ncbi:uncharacterized protein A4U43_UnF3680 [Asparagus officinalis]|uniref:LNS2/PITP domain-containing protein n=1 Tax=Asparagus officinalis TaxID=4686 RepID=A0A1R3L713_ASPOF|nr:phosphatidate phosphatase PAH2-like isoform X2 [Asparagus officinalis]ONK55410.1 uncharacterized protein A4U43_UnF3680 [Asparagus officinalis]
MYAVEKLSSYITRGVYTVSGPFHPFGGAVDIIVVQQQDGSFKSSPWYVRFGKFQGVLKAREKVVTICVNGVEAGFHMYLDPRGEAYFLKDSDTEEGEDFELSPPSFGGEVDEKVRSLSKAQSCNFDGGQREPIVPLENANTKTVSRANSRRSRIFGLMFGNKSMNENDQGANVDGLRSLEHAEVEADLLETKWSKIHQSNDNTNDSFMEKCDESVIDNKIVSSYEDGMVVDFPTTTVSTEQYAEVAVHNSPMVASKSVGDDSNTGESVDSSGEILSDNLQPNIVREVHFEDTITQASTLRTHEKVLEVYTSETGDLGDKSKLVSESVLLESDEHIISSKGSVLDRFTNYAQIIGSMTDELTVVAVEHESEDTKRDSQAHLESDRATDRENYHVPAANDISSISNKGQEFENVGNEFDGEKHCLQNRLNISQDESSFPLSESLEDEQLQFSDIDSFAVKQVNHDVHSILIEEYESKNTNEEECFERVEGSQTSPLAIPISTPRLSIESELLTKSLPIICSQIHDLEISSLLHPVSCSLDINVGSSEKNFLKKEMSHFTKLASDSNFISEAAATAVGSEKREGHNGNLLNPTAELSLCKHLLFEGMGADAASRVFEANKILEPQGRIAVEQYEKNSSADPSAAIIPSEGSWRLWPFSLKRAKTISTVHSAPENVDASPLRSQSLAVHDYMLRAKFPKKKVRSITPTSEDLASLNLREGRNIITFTFSTAMLGQQQVDARIYLWKWNTQIVISDVDGTITKSDVLGQFMPLVGKDWSQTGVAHLFSAIKENGYQLLFLSARAISQAYITRRFLFNLKQDGKALPDGPVVISPDGLFPSLYREVIRRAPHEFKISCLEDIRALFPPECNPFYAGFGNRDTDEFSYLKVGIPKGKIFIVNPRGEVTVHRRVDNKSYTSLHTLVHGMFPPISRVEQEDFNSWNYWKLPLPDVNF